MYRELQEPRQRLPSFSLVREALSGVLGCSSGTHPFPVPLPTNPQHHQPSRRSLSHPAQLHQASLTRHYTSSLPVAQIKSMSGAVVLIPVSHWAQITLKMSTKQQYSVDCVCDRPQHSGDLTRNMILKGKRKGKQTRIQTVLSIDHS